MPAIQSLKSDKITPTKLEGLRVLVIDDDVDVRELAEKILTDAGALVSLADSVRAAFELLVTARPHVIISDIEMPEENGYSFLRNLRSVLDEDGGRTPAIALTGRTLPEDRRRALAAGFNVHLPKPTTATELVQAESALVRPAGLAEVES
jgi:CheY-like chemotaxis protein